MNDEPLQFNYPETIEQTQNIIKVVGVGGGGSNAVQNMYREGIQEVTYLVVNTDRKALDASNVPTRLQISEAGLGAGADPEKGQAFAEQFSDAIRDALSDGTQMAFITAGMGGGTGTGAAPVVAKIAKELGILTIGIVTIPFEFEGVRKIQKALKGVSEMRKNVDALLVVNNTRLAEIYPDLNFFNAFKKADDTLTIAAKSISDIINLTGYMNLDFEDVKRTLENSGVALISTGQASGDNRLSEAIKNAITSPLLQDNEITKAERLLFEVCFSTKNPMTMAESLELKDFVAGLDPNIDVIWGALVDDDLGDDIRIIVLAAGFEMDNGTGEIRANNVKRLNDAAQKKVPLPDKNVPVEAPSTTAPEPPVENPPVVTPPTPPVPPVVTPPVVTPPVPPVPPVVTPPVVTPPAPPVPPVVTPPVVTPPAPPVENPPIEEPKPTAPVEIPVTPTQDPMEGFEQISQYYGKEKAFAMQLEQIRKNYYMLDDQDLSNEELVEKLEHMPAYNRSVEQLGELKKTAQAKTEAPQSLTKNNGHIF